MYKICLSFVCLTLTLVCRTVHAVLVPKGYQFSLCHCVSYTRTTQCMYCEFIILNYNKQFYTSISIVLVFHHRQFATQVRFPIPTLLHAIQNLLKSKLTPPHFLSQLAGYVYVFTVLGACFKFYFNHFYHMKHTKQNTFHNYSKNN